MAGRGGDPIERNKPYALYRIIASEAGALGGAVNQLEKDN
jgi:hypothetical protein